MKIALVGPTYPLRGGISHYTTLLYRAIRKRHDVRLFALKRQYIKPFFPGKTQIDTSQSPLRVPNEPCLDSINPFSWFITFNKIRRFKPHFILFSWWHPFFGPAFGTVSYLALWLARIPSCYLCHNVMPHEPASLDRVLLKYVFASAKAFMTHSRHDYHTLKKIRPAASVYAAFHPTYDAFADDNRLTSNVAKERLGLKGKKVLLFFGLIRKYKGLKYLLEAMRRLKPAQHYSLVIAGEFYEDKDRYRPALNRLTQKGQLTLVDHYIPNEDIPLYFNAADLIVLPYTRASQSGVIQLAYGFCKPVIATRVGGIPEALPDGQTGYLVPPADAKAIADAVQRYFGDEKKQKLRMNIKHMNAAHTWERMVRVIEDMGRRI